MQMRHCQWWVDPAITINNNISVFRSVALMERIEHLQLVALTIVASPASVSLHMHVTHEKVFDTNGVLITLSHCKLRIVNAVSS